MLDTARFLRLWKQSRHFTVIPLSPWFSHYSFYHRNCQKRSFTKMWRYWKECSSFNVETELPGTGSSPSVQQILLGFPRKCKISCSALWVCHCALQYFRTRLTSCDPKDCGHRAQEGIPPRDGGVSWSGVGTVERDVLGALVGAK